MNETTIKVCKRCSHGLKLCAGWVLFWQHFPGSIRGLKTIQNKTCSATSTQKLIKVLWCFFFSCFIPFWIGLVDGLLVSGRRSRLPNDWSVIVLVRIQIPIPSSTMDPEYPCMVLMVLVYSYTFTTIYHTKISHSCRQIYQKSHGSYGLYMQVLWAEACQDSGGRLWQLTLDLCYSTWKMKKNLGEQGSPGVFEWIFLCLTVAFPY